MMKQLSREVYCESGETDCLAEALTHYTDQIYENGLCSAPGVEAPQF